MSLVDEFVKPQEQARATREAMEEAGLALSAVWMRYFSFTGAAGEYEIDAYLNGSMELPAHDRDLVAHAVNELIQELPPRRMAPYSPNGKKPGMGMDLSPDGSHDGKTSQDGKTSLDGKTSQDGKKSPHGRTFGDASRGSRTPGDGKASGGGIREDQ